MIYVGVRVGGGAVSDGVEVFVGGMNVGDRITVGGTGGSSGVNNA